ncbi:MAG: cellulase family glycosylhydrolase [Cyclobacteriaceae bacterium]
MRKGLSIALVLFFTLSTDLLSQSFNKGVNLTNWFQTSSAHEIQFTLFTKTDLEQIKSLGCDVIRLPINLHPMTSGQPDYTIDPLLFDMLDQAVDWAEDLQINLILDNHTFDPAVNTTDSIKYPLLKVWSQMAKHFAQRSQYVYYEILNEPHGIDDSTWANIQQTVIDTIRAHDTNHYIVVGASNWNSYNDLSSLPNYNDSKLIYTFHFYDPFVFTHQGASWASPSLVSLSGVPFPYNASAMPSTPADLKGTWVEGALGNYSNDGTATHIHNLIDIAVAFKTQRSANVYCGEMGAFMPNSNNTDRVAWYQAVRTYLEEKKIPWTMWDYKGDFGLFNKGSYELFNYDLNVPLLEALNFNVPEQKTYVKNPRTSSIVSYDDYIGNGIVNGSYHASGVIDFYSQNNPEDGKYCLYWANVEQYDAIAFDFKPEADLSKLKTHDFELVFQVKGTSPSIKFDMRFVDTKISEADHPWRMGITVDNSLSPNDGQWHEVRIPLKNLIEKGSWDNQWYDPQGLFDWTSIDRFEIVPESQPLDGVEFWYDDLKIIGNTIITDIKQKSESVISAFPNPFAERITIQYDQSSSVTVINQLGMLVKILTNEMLVDGKFQSEWDGKSDKDYRVSSGIYFIKVASTSSTEVIKVILK